MTPEELAEIDLPQRFGRAAWTKRLQSMSRRELDEIIRSGRHKSALERVGVLRKWLNESFVGKSQLIDLMLWCTTAQLPMLMLGTWGTGKSLLVRKLADGMGISPVRISIEHEDGERDRLTANRSRSHDTRAGDKRAADKRTEGMRKDDDRKDDEPDDADRAARHFEYLVTRFTTPEELLGAANVELMLKSAVHMRQTRGLLPRAEIAFLDEVFKANSSILNALLGILNERIFHNAGRVWRVNLMMLFGASNEIPRQDDGDELGAFYDRFPVRAVCDPVGDDELPDLLKKSHGHAFAAEFANDAPQRPANLPCVNDFRLLHRVSLVKFGGAQLHDDTKESREFLERFHTLFRHLRAPQQLSDRSFGQYYRLARCRALLEGREHLERQDCQILYYCGKDPRAASELRAWVDRTLMH